MLVKAYLMLNALSIEHFNAPASYFTEVSLPPDVCCSLYVLSLPVAIEQIPKDIFEGAVAAKL